MGLDFSKTGMAAASGTAATVENEIEAVQPYDIVADRKQMNETLVDSQEVDAIVSTIEVYNPRDDCILWLGSGGRGLKGVRYRAEQYEYASTG